MCKMENGIKYLISGSSGIVAKYIIKELLSDPNKYFCKQIVALSRRNRYVYDEHPDRNSAMLLDCYGELRYNCVRLISQFQPSIVIHCAGIGTQASPAKDLWHANVDTTLNLLEACRVLNEIRFVYCSSIVVEQNPPNVYAASKIAGEALCQAYNNGGITTQIVRFPAVAGAGNKHGVVKAVVEKLLDKSTLTLSLLDNSYKPIIYAGDLARNILDMINNTKCPMYNLCPSDFITVGTIAVLAMQKTGINKEVIWLEDKNEVVYPTGSKRIVTKSREAVALAIDDILKEDYQWE